MKHSLLGGLTVAVAMSVLGAPLPSQAQDASSSGHSLDAEAEHHFDALASTPRADADLLIDANSSSLTLAELESALSAQSPDQTNETKSSNETSDEADTALVATVYPHALDARQAATVYIRSIPVITLVGNELETLSASSRPAAIAPDRETLINQANAILTHLEQLAADGDANDITARWNSDDEAFEVAWGEETVVTVNDQTILPDTTENPGEDVLQIANRLRRLLGDAPALARVEGLPQPEPEALVGAVSRTFSGMASWYGPGLHGRRSASGEVFNQNALTAAHRTLPFGTRVRVTNLSNGQSVVVRINDRGPFGHGRVIDLSSAAASTIGIRASGVGQVQLEVLAD